MSFDPSRYSAYAGDITCVPGVLVSKWVARTQALAEKEGVWRDIVGLVPEYRAQIGRAERGDISGFNLLVVRHHEALARGKAAQRRLDGLEVDIRALEKVTTDPQFKEALRKADKANPPLFDEEAAAKRMWGPARAEAMQALPRGLRVGSGTDPGACSSLHPLQTEPGMWVMSPAHRSPRATASVVLYPTYILMESLVRGERDTVKDSARHRHFYVWSQSASDEGVHRVAEADLRGVPRP
jgi:hypothetical protein